ncbi:hypothetical protein GALMADRAFT_1243710 [Galerina marginata CBS 339.88]|uniref:Uncharacterized protein n=1 Tax=Galerina marginata (strain CBS 339.88) TaxID=685588 RepID=A0A067TKN9_GALM3|nr:hypothetical protein GALMADRAFT_1243710 [Galerina marginata CBS 339.88]
MSNRSFLKRDRVLEGGQSTEFRDLISFNNRHIVTAAEFGEILSVLWYTKHQTALLNAFDLEILEYDRRNANKEAVENLKKINQIQFDANEDLEPLGLNLG